MEADVLRWPLIIIGSLVIVGVAVHGIWTSRKNTEKKSSTNKHQSEQELQFNEQDSEDWESKNEVFDEITTDNNEVINEPVINFDIDSNETEQQLTSNLKQPSTDEFDELGIGAVRVVSVAKEQSETQNTQQDTSTTAELSTEQNEEPDTQPSKIYASVVTQPKPEYVPKYQSSSEESEQTCEVKDQNSVKVDDIPKTPKTLVNSDLAASQNNGAMASDSYQAPEPPPFLLKQETAESFQSHNEEKSAEKSPQTSSVNKASLAEQASNLVKRKKPEPARKRREPKMAEDQLHIDFDDVPEATPKQQPTAPMQEQPKPKLEPKPKENQQQEVLVLNVKSAEDQPIPGSALLPMLLTLGFKFGEQDIFHRHVNANGKGEVLFSLANMFKPGNFDIDNLENFTTQGISLFMILPIEGDPHQVFNMMHNAARKIADEFSAQIYDGKRALLTKQSLQQYVEKIREFERQRLLTS